MTRRREPPVSGFRDAGSRERFLAAYDAALAGLHIEGTHLVGLSYGAWLALNHAVRSPGRVRSVTAVDPPGALGAGRLDSRARRLIANVDVRLIPDAGHMLPVQLPGLFVDHVQRFLGGLGEADSGR